MHIFYIYLHIWVVILFLRILCVKEKFGLHIGFESTLCMDMQLTRSPAFGQSHECEAGDLGLTSIITNQSILCD